MNGSEDAVGFRLWPPVAIGAPLFAGWLATLLWGDPVDLGGWRVPLGWVLVLLFVSGNGGCSGGTRLGCCRGRGRTR